MRRQLLAVVVVLAAAVTGRAQGLLVPDDAAVAPLAAVKQQVAVKIEDQAAVTRIDQTFRNPTDKALAATFVFPVPRGASVNQFTLTIDGKETKGEVLEAAKAAEYYSSVIRRAQNPALLEHLDRPVVRVKVTPPANADQKVSISYTSIAGREGDLIEYTYPLRADTGRTLPDFSLTATIKGQHAIQNVYSPTHALAVKRASDRAVTASFDRAAALDKDFRLFWSLGQSDVGLTALTHRPAKDENGYFMMLVAPKVEMAKDNQIARDMVFVLDTSGSMRGVKLEQAKKALKFCLNNVGSKDRFGVIEFSASVKRYKETLTERTDDEIAKATAWVNNLQATGGTNINDSLLSALAMRSNEAGRTFNVVFFTDGLPSTSERNPEQIIKNVMAKNSGETRIFSFGVGNDVNATFLDRLATETRALSSYVRPNEDIEEKVSVLYSKISNPVLANLKLAVGPDVMIEEVYPPHLPDLFDGGQLVVLGRYRGQGAANIKLTGNVGKEAKEFNYKVNFVSQSKEDKDFVENLWASRKIGYLLDQIRSNGEKKELVDEVTTLAKKYGIATPYTSYLVVSDANVARKANGLGDGKGAAPAALAGAGAPGKVAEVAKQVQNKPGDLVANRGAFEDRKLQAPAPAAGPEADKDEQKARGEAKEKKEAYDRAREALLRRDQAGVQGGKLGVDLSVQNNGLRNQSRLEQTAVRKAASRNLLEIGGVWIDDGFDPKMTTVAVKAMSDAYFRILQKHPQMKEVFLLGNHVVWVAPSGAALVLDTTDGKDKLTDEEIATLFAPKK